MAIETGIYGEVTIRHELAHGIYQLIFAAGNQLRALIIGKEFAKQVLSQSALSMADDYDENHLGYPEQDGRMSIPMLELNQKGLINIPLQEAKEHFNNLVHLVPEYLRRRGILKEKSLPDMRTKLADEPLNKSNVTQLSHEAFVDYVDHISKPVVMTAAAYSNFRDQQIIERAKTFEEEAKPFMQELPKFSPEAVSVIISDIAIEAVDDMINEEVSQAAAVSPAEAIEIQPPEVPDEIIEEEIEVEI